LKFTDYTLSCTQETTSLVAALPTAVNHSKEKDQSTLDI